MYDQIIKDSMTSDYPTFANLNESLKMLDKAVKMVKIGEKNKAIKYIDDFNSNNNITKSVGWAILTCLNSTSSRDGNMVKKKKHLVKALVSKYNLY